ncbi:MAG: cell division protein FtsL [Nitrospirota bacterium]
MSPEAKDVTLIGTLGLIIVTLSFLSLWQRTRMNQIGYEIQAMRTQKTELMKIHKQLLIEAESISALDRIEEVATRQLGMVPASSETRIYVQGRHGHLRD